MTRFLVTHCRAVNGEIVHASSAEHAARQAFERDSKRKKPRYAIQMGDSSNYITVYELLSPQPFRPVLAPVRVIGVEEGP